MNTTIYLVRHGQSHSNAGIYTNAQNELETTLTAKGIEQAQARADELKQVPFTAAYASDLIRAVQTAEIIAMPHKLHVTQSPLLRERRYTLPGDEEALRHEVHHLNSILDTPDNMSEEEKFLYKSNPAMENGREVVTRLNQFFGDVYKKHQNENILVVSHGNTMRTLLFHMGYAMHHQIPAGSVVNTGYIKLQCNLPELRVVDLCDITTRH